MHFVTQLMSAMLNLKSQHEPVYTLYRLGEVTLKDVKAAVDREGSYRYHFKALDPEFGTVKEEVREGKKNNKTGCTLLRMKLCAIILAGDSFFTFFLIHS